MKTHPKPVSKNVREYLKFIGGRGGQTSRRELTKAQARQMVAIREAKRALAREGRPVSALERWPLKVAPREPDQRRGPAIQPDGFRIYKRGNVR
jgi:hypothetical protein